MHWAHTGNVPPGLHGTVPRTASAGATRKQYVRRMTIEGVARQAWLLSAGCHALCDLPGAANGSDRPMRAAQALAGRPLRRVPADRLSPGVRFIVAQHLTPGEAAHAMIEEQRLKRHGVGCTAGGHVKWGTAAAVWSGI
jgi:hypothetical protein